MIWMHVSRVPYCLIAGVTRLRPCGIRIAGANPGDKLGLHKAPLAPDTRGRDGARLDEIAHGVGMNLEQPGGFGNGQDMLARLAHRSAPSAPPQDRKSTRLNSSH